MPRPGKPTPFTREEKENRYGYSGTRSRIHSTIDAMPPEKLDAVLTFLEDLQRSSEEETAMLMGDAGFMKEYREAKEDIRTGKTVSFKAIRRDV